MTAKRTYTLQFELNEKGERFRSELAGLLIGRMCEENPILGQPGQSLMINGPSSENNQVQLTIHAREDAFRDDVMTSETLADAAMKCAVLYGLDGKASGWVHFPEKLAFSDNPEGDTFHWSELASKIASYKDDPLSLVDDPSLKLYLKRFQAYETDDESFNRVVDALTTIAIAGSKREKEVVTGYLSKVTDDGVKITCGEFLEVLNHGKPSYAKRIIQSSHEPNRGDIKPEDLVDPIENAAPLLDFSWLDDDFQTAYRATINEHVDDIDPFAAGVLITLLSDKEFIQSNKNELHTGFEYLMVSHVVELAYPDEDKRSETCQKVLLHLENIDSAYSQSLNPM